MIEIPLSDIDFYEGKIKNLEEDNICMHEEIMKLRARLRTAEDYEIKYSLLVSANQKEMGRLKGTLEKQYEAQWQSILATKLKESDEVWQTNFMKLEQKLKSEADKELESLRMQLSQKSEELLSLKTKSEEIQLFGFKMNKTEKENQSLKEQIQQMRLYYEKQKAEELTKLRLTLNTTYRQRIENQKNRYEERINELLNKLNGLEIKDDNVNFKASEATNRELVSLRASFEEKSKFYAQEMKNSQHLLIQKNEEIKSMIQDRYRSDEKHRSQIAERNEYIKELENKILSREKQHEIQLLNLVERTNATIEQQKLQLSNQIKHLNDQNNRFQQLWSERILNHQNEIDELHNKFDDERRRLIEDKNMHKRKISDLSLKMREAEGEREMGETQMLINSLRDIDGKEDRVGAYQNGITFLERHYKKCQLKLQEKSRIVSKLYKEINDIRTQAENQLLELKQKLKKEKKESNERIIALENQLLETTDKLKVKQRQQRKRQRQASKELIELEERNKALKQLHEELQRDYRRIIEDKKDVEASYRQEREKSFASKTDLNVIKKQKWLELQKQKNELHIIFKQKQQQIKLSCEQKLDELNNQLNRTKQDLEIALKNNELLQKENLQYMQKLEMNKSNSKFAQYNKKITSLNLEIALTQNLCESLKKAKSRINPSASPADFEDHVTVRQFDQILSEEPLNFSFHPSTPVIK